MFGSTVFNLCSNLVNTCFLMCLLINLTCLVLSAVSTVNLVNSLYLSGERRHCWPEWWSGGSAGARFRSVEAQPWATVHQPEDETWIWSSVNPSAPRWTHSCSSGKNKIWSNAFCIASYQKWHGLTQQHQARHISYGKCNKNNKSNNNDAGLDSHFSVHDKWKEENS